VIELNRILCPIDFSEYSTRALRYAARIALWSRAELRVLHVMPLLPPSTSSSLAEVGRLLTERNLNAAIEKVRTVDLKVTGELVESGDAATAILEQAEAFDADLVITGSHGRSGVARAMLGSVVEVLLHKCRRPMLAVPSHCDPTRLDSTITMREIVCAVDFAAASLTGLAYALSIAEEADAHLTLLHVIEVPPELLSRPEPPYGTVDVEAVRAEAEADALSRLRKLVPQHARDYCTIETSVLEGGVSRQVLRLAQDRHADLIAIGVHGRNALDLAIFGSNSKDILRHACCPVLIVPAGPLRTPLRRAS
jgi:nucleotide-binding universal stress UspA family protein